MKNLSTAAAVVILLVIVAAGLKDLAFTDLT